VATPSRESVAVTEGGRTLEFTFEDLLRYHGPGSPAGVACAFKAMQRAFAVLSRDGTPPRRSVVVRTPFRGPGARDGFEAVTRAVTDGRYVVDRALVRPDRGILLEDFVFEISLASADVDPVMLLLRDGFVTDEFIGLARTARRTAAQEERLDELKAVMAGLLTATPAAEVFEVGQIPGAR
jgi:hypothetical protein